MRFEKVAEGYRDHKTNLVWREEDEPGQFPYSEAMELADSVWRMPTMIELLGIVDYAMDNPTTQLPNIEPLHYWSRSLSDRYSARAWGINFEYGSSYDAVLGMYRRVRLVQAGEIGEI